MTTAYKNIPIDFAAPHDPNNEYDVQEISIGLWEQLVGSVLPASVRVDPPEITHILIGSLRDGRLRVVEPIQVNLYRESESLVAEATDLNEFGFGNNQSEAIIDLQQTIAELYFSLRDHKDRLGPDLQRVWETLNRTVNLMNGT